MLGCVVIRMYYERHRRDIISSVSIAASSDLANVDVVEREASNCASEDATAPLACVRRK